MKRKKPPLLATMDGFDGFGLPVYLQANNAH
jgi:hypothetical protein